MYEYQIKSLGKNIANDLIIESEDRKHEWIILKLYKANAKT